MEFIKEITRFLFGGIFMSICAALLFLTMAGLIKLLSVIIIPWFV